MTQKQRWIGLAGCLAIAFTLTAGVAVHGQGTGVASKVGQKLDEVGRGLGRTMKAGFETVRTEVGRMGLHPRVYSRINWDKALHGSKIEVHILREGVVLLRGTVPDPPAKRHAAVLASETVGVNEVVDELVPLINESVTPAVDATPKAASREATVPRTR